MLRENNARICSSGSLLSLWAEMFDIETFVHWTVD